MLKESMKKKKKLCGKVRNSIKRCHMLNTAAADKCTHLCKL